MRVIAKKSRPAPSNSLLGYIQPVLKFDDNELVFKEVNDLIDFPNDGEIFVIKGYNFIDNEFDHDELFEIDDIKINDNNYKEERAGSCYYTVNNANPKKIKEWEYIPIFEIEFDLDRRSVQNLNLNKNGSAFFIKDKGYLYGPFTCDIVTLSALTINYFDVEDLPDDNTIEDFLYDKQDFIFKYDLNYLQEVLVGNFVVDLQLLFKKKPIENIYFGTKEKIIEWGKRTFSSNLNDSERLILDKINDLDIPNSNSQTELENSLKLTI